MFLPLQIYEHLSLHEYAKQHRLYSCQMQYIPNLMNLLDCESKEIHEEVLLSKLLESDVFKNDEHSEIDIKKAIRKYRKLEKSNDIDPQRAFTAITKKNPNNGKTEVYDYSMTRIKFVQTFNRMFPRNHICPGYFCDRAIEIVSSFTNYHDEWTMLVDNLAQNERFQLGKAKNKENIIYWYAGYDKSGSLVLKVGTSDQLTLSRHNKLRGDFATQLLCFNLFRVYYSNAYLTIEADLHRDFQQYKYGELSNGAGKHEFFLIKDRLLMPNIDSYIKEKNRLLNYCAYKRKFSDTHEVDDHRNMKYIESKSKREESIEMLKETLSETSVDFEEFLKMCMEANCDSVNSYDKRIVLIQEIQKMPKSLQVQAIPVLINVLRSKVLAHQLISLYHSVNAIDDLGNSLLYP